MEKCGWEDLPCQLWKTALDNKATTDEESGAQVWITPLTLVLGDAQTSETDSLSFTGATNIYTVRARTSSATETTQVTKPVSSVGAHPVFLVTAKDVVFSSIIHSLNASSTPLVFEVSSWLLELQSVSIYPSTNEILTLSNSIIGVCSGGSLSLDDCMFENVSYRGNGPVVNAVLNSGSSFAIKSTSTFTQCSAEFGGCIYLDIRNGYESMNQMNLMNQNCGRKILLIYRKCRRRN